MITDEQIRALRTEAARAGDTTQVRLCDIALGEASILGYTTWGSVRGMGPVRMTRAEAEADLAHDAKGCSKHGGYSDREVYAIDGDRYVVDADDHKSNVYPYGPTGAALRLGRGDARPVPEWMDPTAARAECERVIEAARAAGP